LRVSASGSTTWAQYAVGRRRRRRLPFTKCYQNRFIETVQVMEELIAMAKKFKEEAERGANSGLNSDELASYDALADNEK
jgi:hypothetical protein